MQFLGEEKDAKFYHMSSFSESKAQKIIEDHDLAVKFVKYNTKQISRIYPGATRQDSSNLHPMEPWAAGCQIGTFNENSKKNSDFLYFSCSELSN